MTRRPPTSAPVFRAKKSPSRGLGRDTQHATSPKIDLAKKEKDGLQPPREGDTHERCPVALAPLEMLALPEALDGQHGSNRIQHETNQLGATNDIEAVQQFLNEYLDSPATHRSYKKEIECLLLWAVIECGKPLSSLTRDDFSAYSEFLADPQPSDRWCGIKRGRRGKRFTSGWRPFVGPLSPTGRRTALVIINSMMNYLVQARYLSGNPLGLLRQRHRTGGGPISARTKRDVWERTLDDRQWNTLVATIDQLPRETPQEIALYERIRYIVALLHFLALRVGEIQDHTMGSFVNVRGRWKFYVTGKGAKDADVPVSSAMLEALQQYRTHLGLSDLPHPNEETPLVLNLTGKRGVTARRINQVLKDILHTAALRLEAEDPTAANGLRKASAHWFRHTSITRQSEQGIPLAHLKANARHSKVDTTMLYVHTDDVERHEHIEKLKW